MSGKAENSAILRGFYWTLRRDAALIALGPRAGHG